MSVKIKNDELWGMGIYELLPDGNILGRWNNNLVPGTTGLHLEIARKIKGNAEEFRGNYTVTWIAGNGVSIQGVLEIRTVRIGNVESELELIWIEDGKIIFRGTGVRIGPNQFAMIYWQDDIPELKSPLRRQL